ncbi:uncharacterized protein IL334_005227 [Kwoniella shivajii]|uniref:Uncharacterized protein n=1 Tax=Kwoniella shivajii TaxID=564305 RepID=A0ABZ1D315_9TREE|nr:hypothetical protein IL334_005227 [Kwoniella shivajii]
MIMTSSPIMTPSCRSIAHTPSPSSSPKLVPVASTMIKPNSPFTLPSSSVNNQSGSGSGMGSGLSTSVPTRSYVRGPQARPYAQPARNIKQITGDSKQFTELVASMVNKREQEKRKQDITIEMIENVNISQDAVTTTTSPTATRHLDVPKRAKSLAGSLAGSWEVERAELIVDIPVWSPGCFQDLSTLHALRDTTLSHTHALLSHLLNDHSVPATYRLLARSCVQPNHHDHTSHHHGWGCIRLAPSITSPISTQIELKPSVRRASLVHSHSSPITHTRKNNRNVSHDLDNNCHENVIIESDDEDNNFEFEIKLKEGYSRSSISISDDESDEEEESADVIVGREIERRGGKEGMAFLMTLFGQPALILT